ncbi:MAG: AraC family transcriptional regulator [Spirochaetia bacterium]|nr:AraC family transcriptional regulator [Spirochaetia bacterium]
MQNTQLITDLCIINNINYIIIDNSTNIPLSNCDSKLLDCLELKKSLFKIISNDYQYIIIKNDKKYILGPFEKDTILINDCAKLFYYLINRKTYTKKTIETLHENINIIFNEINIQREKTISFDINIMEFLEESIKTGDIETLKLFIKIMFVSLGKLNTEIDSFRLQKNLIIYIFSYIFNTLEKNKIDPDFNNFLTSIITSEFEFCDNSSQLLFKTYQLIDKINDSFNFTNKKSTQKIREAKYYINNNLEKKLTLEKVAKEMGISAKYLSTLFFEISNTTFKEYVNRQRIDKARNLLSYSDKSISEISVLVGIKSPNNFISFFKKYTHTTPNSFREQIE